MSQEPELLEDIEAYLMEEARQDGPSPAETALAIKPQQGLTDNLTKQVSCFQSQTLAGPLVSYWLTYSCAQLKTEHILTLC